MPGLTSLRKATSPRLSPFQTTTIIHHHLVYGPSTIPMVKERLEIIETDEAGNVTATYVQSSTDREGISRIDSIVRRISTMPTVPAC